MSFKKFIIISSLTTIVSIGNLFIKTSVYAQQETKANENTIVVKTSSGESETGLAKYLNQIHAKMYGVYWCSHCQAQLSIFGKEASELLDHIECDSEGKDAKTKECDAEEITSYPTWIINGSRYEGTQTLEELAQESGYKGLQNFKNPNPE